jgi:aminoglycoside phosphotransferase (APT) family kinase protein
MPHAPVQRLEAIVGAPIVEDALAPWGFENDTHLVTTADGRRLAVQRLHDRARARTRLQVVTIEDRLRAAGIPVPVFVAGHAGQPADDETATEPHFVTIQVDGSPGNTLLDEPTEARALATAMGRLQRSLAAVDIEVATDAGLDRTWVDPGALARSTRGWMADSAAWLDDATRLAIEHLIDQLPEMLVGRIGVLAHGDFVPVNVLVRDLAIVALLDWEDARIADPVLDVAWWLWVVHHHHPEVHRRIAGTFRDAAGIPSDETTASRMELLVTLRHLEILARSRGADSERTRRRAANLRSVLAGSAAAAFRP